MKRKRPSLPQDYKLMLLLVKMVFDCPDKGLTYELTLFKLFSASANDLHSNTFYSEFSIYLLFNI